MTLALGATLLGACSGSDDGGAGTVALAPGDYAFVSGATPVTFDAGQIERLALGDEIVSSGFGEATESDIVVATDGTDVYQIGRRDLDSLTRFTPGDLRTPVWQYSVSGDEMQPNPYDVVFASPTKAYVIRYDSARVWIVDPSATTEADFKTGELDLSAYDDGPVEASDGLIVDGKLFVLMQRLDDFAPTRNGYVAVFDVASDEEIDTGTDDGLPGIALATRNPSTLAYVEETDEIHVVGRGNPFNAFNDVPGDPYEGGVETIDPDDYTLGLLIDDGTEADNRGFVVDALVVSATKGYLLTYRTDETSGTGLSTLYTFDPMSGLVAESPVEGFVDRDISVLAEGPEGRVWIGLNDPVTPGFTLLDPSDDSVAVESVRTEFNPNAIVFVEVPGGS